MPKIVMEKEHSLARTGATTKGALELDEVLQSSSLTQFLVVQHAIKIDQIKLPVQLPVALDEQIGITHISGIETRRMKRPQELGQRLQKNAPLRACPLSLVIAPVCVERDLSQQRFATIPALTHGARDPLFDGGQGACDRKAMRLEQLRPMPGATGR
jgi:hypothetical protein